MGKLSKKKNGLLEMSGIIKFPYIPQAVCMVECSKKKKAERASCYFLLLMALSFVGWAFENSYMLLSTGKFYNTGFMSMPFCPIYGTSIIITYFLLGTPDCGRGILKRTQNALLRNALYIGFAFLIPSLAELLVGAFFDKTFDMWLWSYSHLPYNLYGYVCLPVSLIWAGLLYVFMKYAFLPLKRLFFRLNGRFAVILALLLFAAVTMDLTANYRLIWGRL